MEHRQVPQPGLIETLRSEPTLIAVDRSDVEQMVDRLRDSWGISAAAGRQADPLDRLPEVPPTQRLAYDRLHSLQACYLKRGQRIPTSLECEFYDLLSEQPIGGVVHSQKFPYILDTAAVVVSLARQLKWQGRLLDLGCHIGYHSDIWARMLELQVTGADLSARAIHAARKVCGDRSNLSFEHLDHQRGDIPAADVVVCIDAFPRHPSSLRVFLKSIVRSLNPGGLVALGGDLLAFGDGILASACKWAGLGLGLIDVTGGWTGAAHGFDSRLLLLLSREFSGQVPSNVSAQWGNFIEYANSEKTPWAEKTQAFYRAQLKAAASSASLGR